VTGRSAVYARGGLVATSQPLASLAGAEVLAQGGNAADAAVAAAGALFATMPMMCGLGGDAFALHYDHGRGRLTAFSGSGAAPALATPEAYADRGHRAAVPERGPLAVTVPGAVDALVALLAVAGSGRFGLPALWRRAVAYAEAHPVAPKTAAAWAGAPEAIRPGGPPAPGTVVRQPELARTLEAVASQGPDWFYRGPFARAVDAHMRERGGFLRAEDLAAHRTRVEAPLALPVPFAGLRLFATPPPSHGAVLLEILGLLAEDEDLDPLSPEGVHLAVEAKKLAFADRLAHLGDPEAVPFRAERLLDPAYLRRRRRDIGPRAAAAVAAGDPSPPDTTSLVVVDGRGDAASVIVSLFSAWGSGEVVPGTGVVLNNRGHGFSLRPDHPNRLAPGKRTMHTLHAYLALDGRGELALLGGTPGGDNQPPWNAQVLLHLLRGGADPQEAVERPRWSSAPGTTPPESEAGLPYALTLEDGFPPGVPEALAALGHDVRRVGRWAGGGAAQVIVRVGDGVFAAGSDPRADGSAVGL
jgi:gamma-glutamyltranspeptidase/glutathione hydrolase